MCPGHECCESTAEAGAADVVVEHAAARPDEANLGIVVTQTLSGLDEPRMVPSSARC